MIIGIVGFIGSGKGTVGDILVEKHRFEKVAFASRLKDAVSILFGWERALLEGDTKESREFRETKDEFWSARLDKEITPRYALQLMGTEAGRNVFGENFWITSFEKSIEGKKNVVITDVRFPNEIKFIQDRGGFVTRVSRGKDPEWYQAALSDNRMGSNLMLSNYPNVHFSEWAWIGCNADYAIYNDSTISMLEADVEHMLKIFTGPLTIEAA